MDVYHVLTILLFSFLLDLLNFNFNVVSLNFFLNTSKMKPKIAKLINPFENSQRYLI